MSRRRALVALVLAFTLALALAACRSSASTVIPEARADPAPVEASAQPVAVVELFTSEGCSSCPPADAVLAELERDAPTVYALAFHVDYWDALGWPDPFASADRTERQRQYARSFGTSSLYTPEMIVGGTDAFTGSDRRRAHASVAQALSHKASVRVSLHARLRGGDEVAVDADAPAAPPGSVVVVALVQRGATIDVRAGENAGRALTHTSIVRAFAVARAPRASLTLRVPPSLSPSDADVVAFVQRESSDGGGMPILGASRAPVRE